MNNTLIKGLRLLETLARLRRPAGVSELAAALRSPKSGVHRLLQALVDERYVVRHEAGGYATSIKLWELGSAVLSGFDLRRHADPLMEALMRSTGETVHLSVLDQHEVVYVHKVESESPVRAYTQIGGRAPAHCVATGKVLMAYQSKAWLEAVSRDLVPATARTLTDPEAFAAEMRKVRRLGYAINRGEWRPSVNGLAAPILDAGGAVIAAIGVSGPETRLKLARLKSLAGEVCEAGIALSAEFDRAGAPASLLGVLRHWKSEAL